jgi:2'-5' RNA ligase
VTAGGRPAPGSRARLFAALDLPAPVRAELAAFGRAAAAGDPALRAVGEDSLHVTLIFLGQRPLNDIDAAGQVVEEAASGVAAPLLELGAPLWLSPRRPHVLTVELHDRAGALAALQAAVAAGFGDALGFEPEARPFLPHVTVARVRRGAVARRDELPALPPLAEPSFPGEAVTLYRSRLGGGPARYEPLTRVPLVTKA